MLTRRAFNDRAAHDGARSNLDRRLYAEHRTGEFACWFGSRLHLLMESVTLTLTARQWGTIDAVMDLAVQRLEDDGDDASVPLNVRQSGWDQVPWVGEDRAWPPDTQAITITLTPAEWQYATETLAGYGQDDPLVSDALAAMRRQSAAGT